MILLTPQSAQLSLISSLALIMPTSSSRLLVVVVLAFLILLPSITSTVLVLMSIRARTRLALPARVLSLARRNVLTLLHTVLLTWRRQVNMMLLSQAQPSLISTTMALPLLHQVLLYPRMLSQKPMTLQVR